VSFPHDNVCIKQTADPFPSCISDPPACALSDGDQQANAALTQTLHPGGGEGCGDVSAILTLL